MKDRNNKALARHQAKIKWNSNKLWGEIKKALEKKYSDTELVSNGGEYFTYQLLNKDKKDKSTYKCDYLIFMDELQIDWEKAEKILKYTRSKPPKGK
jgi:heme oxygenase